MRILQLIASGTLANAGRPERVKNKKHAHLCAFSCLWVPLGAFGCLWVPLGAFGCLWVSLGPFAYFKVLFRSFNSFSLWLWTYGSFDRSFLGLFWFVWFYLGICVGFFMHISVSGSFLKSFLKALS
jgi:hypothetical protein